MIDHTETDIHSLLKSDFDAHLPLHISLSRPIVLRAEQRQPFLERLSCEIERSGVQPYVLDWLNFHQYVSNARAIGLT